MGVPLPPLEESSHQQHERPIGATTSARPAGGAQRRWACLAELAGGGAPAPPRLGLTRQALNAPLPYRFSPGGFGALSAADDARLRSLSSLLAFTRSVAPGIPPPPLRPPAAAPAPRPPPAAFTDLPPNSPPPLAEESDGELDWDGNAFPLLVPNLPPASPPPLGVDDVCPWGLMDEDDESDDGDGDALMQVGSPNASAQLGFTACLALGAGTDAHLLQSLGHCLLALAPPSWPPNSASLPAHAPRRRRGGHCCGQRATPLASPLCDVLCPASAVPAAAFVGPREAAPATASWPRCCAGSPCASCRADLARRMLRAPRQQRQAWHSRWRLSWQAWPLASPSLPASTRAACTLACCLACRTPPTCCRAWPGIRGRLRPRSCPAAGSCAPNSQPTTGITAVAVRQLMCSRFHQS